MRSQVPGATCLAALLLGAAAGASALAGQAAVARPAGPQVTLRGQAEAPEPSRLLVAVMRRDGVMVPFAEYEKGKWSTPWPTGLRNVDLPADLAAVPDGWWGGDPVGEWTFWPAGGGDPAPLKAEAPIVLTVGWERRLGIRTGYRSSEPQALFAALPYPKDGIALAGGGRLEPVASVSRLVPRWRELIPSLEADVDAAEEKTVRELINRKIWVHPVPQPERAARSAELEAWYTAMLNQPGWSTSYIEAVKKYPPGPDDEGCGLETFISGWVHHNTRTSKPKTELTAKISYCDRAGVSYMLPFGLLRLRNRTHWVVQISSHEQEWYGVVEATPDRVRFAAEYFGGGRPGAR